MLRGVAAAILQASLLACDSSDLSADLPAVPHPDLTRVEPAVREQLASARERLAQIRQAEGLEPAVLGDHYGEMARLLLTYEFEDAAAVCLENATSLDPTDYRWWYYLAHHRRQTRDHAASRPAYRRAIKLNPSYLPARTALGESLIEANRLEEAAIVLARVVEMEVADAAALTGLGRIAMAQSRHAQAIEYLAAALSIAPDVAVIRYHLAMVYRAMGDHEQARQLLHLPNQRTVDFPDPLIDDLQQLIVGAHAFNTKGNDAFR